MLCLYISGNDFILSLLYFLNKVNCMDWPSNIQLNLPSRDKPYLRGHHVITFSYILLGSNAKIMLRNFPFISSSSPANFSRHFLRALLLGASYMFMITPDSWPLHHYPAIFPFCSFTLNRHLLYAGHWVHCWNWKKKKKSVFLSNNSQYNYGGKQQNQ